MIQRRSVTGLLLVALLAVANASGTSLCNANCARAVIGSHSEHLHHQRSLPFSGAQHHYHDGVTSSAGDSLSFVTFRSPECEVYAQFEALLVSSKSGLASPAFSAETGAVIETPTSILAAPDQDLFLPTWVHSPPGSGQASVVAPLRI